MVFSMYSVSANTFGKHRNHDIIPQFIVHFPLLIIDILRVLLQAIWRSSLIWKTQIWITAEYKNNNLPLQ